MVAMCLGFLSTCLGSLLAVDVVVAGLWKLGGTGLLAWMFALGLVGGLVAATLAPVRRLALALALVAGALCGPAVALLAMQ